jgi:hypothetical protein
MNNLGIDVETKDVQKLITYLSKLKSVESVVNNGTYRDDFNYSQVLIKTTMSENKLDYTLYSKKGINYVGVFKVKESEVIENES